MNAVWILTEYQLLVRADWIILLQGDENGLRADCKTGQIVQLTRTVCSMASQLALLEEIRKASVEESRASIILPVDEQNSLTWHREPAESLADHFRKQEVDADAPNAVPIFRSTR